MELVGLFHLNPILKKGLGPEGLNNLMPQDEALVFKTNNADSGSSEWTVKKQWNGTYTVFVKPEGSDEGGHTFNFKDKNKNGFIELADLEPFKPLSKETEEAFNKNLPNLTKAKDITAYQVEIPKEFAEVLNNVLQQSGRSLKDLDGVASVISTRPSGKTPGGSIVYTAINHVGGTPHDTELVDVEVNPKNGKIRFYSTNGIGVKVFDADNDGVVTPSVVPVQPKDGKDRFRFGLSPEEVKSAVKLLKNGGDFVPYKFGAGYPLFPKPEQNVPEGETSEE
jgi:hypothetical protein